MRIEDTGWLELINPVCHSLLSNFKKDSVVHVRIPEMHYETNSIIQGFEIWCGHLNVRYSRSVTEIVMRSIKQLQQTVLHFVLILTVKTRHTICIWLQICGAVCSHHVTVQHPDYNMILLRSLFFICWNVAIMRHCVWLSCLRAVTAEMWLLGVYLLVTTPADLISFHPALIVFVQQEQRRAETFDGQVLKVKNEYLELKLQRSVD